MGAFARRRLPRGSALLVAAAAFGPLGAAATLRRKSHDSLDRRMESKGNGNSSEALGSTASNSTEPLFGDLSIGSYPSWKEARCHSQGEFFCDPEGSLSLEAQAAVAKELQGIRDEVTVTCGQLDTVLAGTDQTHSRNFNLGVAIADHWPESEADPTALQNFGMVLMSQWGLMPIYNGVDTNNGVTQSSSFREYTSNCPNVAMLIILPRYGEAYLSSPSCEFLCNERGGPEVANAIFTAWEAGGLAAATKAGIQEVRRIIQDPAPLSLRRADEAYQRRKWALEWNRRLTPNEFTTTLAQRGGLLLFIVFTIIILFAFAAYSLAPEPRKGMKSGSRA